MSAPTAAAEIKDILTRLGVAPSAYTAGDTVIKSPVTGETIAQVNEMTADQAKAEIEKSATAFKAWRTVPAPRRGELVRLLGEELRTAKEDLGRIISIEVGKIPSEGLGEIQEMIDICDFAVGLSRQLYGLTISTERPGHRMMEQWHPVGPVGVISAFNFPAAVWSWNSALAIVCGNPVIWKPSEKTPLISLACAAVLDRAIARFGDAPAGLHTLLIGDRDVGEVLVDHPKVPVISATGSTRMGREVGPRVAARFGKSILELGGNNAGIVCPSADQDMALAAIAFGAMGTAGQRCTSQRRTFVHDSIYDTFVPRLQAAYKSVSIGSPLNTDSLVGPLIDERSDRAMVAALDAAKAAGGTVVGGEKIDAGYPDAFYRRPAVVEMPTHDGIVCEETFAPILYVMRYTDLDDAIELQNAVGAGLSSTIFTLDVREAEQFMSAAGSDCGIANVNIGTSGAEIGGAFGGEKETGGGRESGSDAWKAYMRRATNTINYSRDLPLAQGVSFDIS
ncbi:L-piperidine-6-carboxylate dehydrogenase [Cochlodiniinecator piscidefendens]|uniref:L-piperidine-6-carboxylate dehydrogenase n=1 Tax=Cochlodiniinecator piscidefendens TaxID=2715756 RepID=UPI001407FAFB|nr:aldehyde dehydrogenase family protein [Cochlodiniinecator piscidefendens]